MTGGRCRAVRTRLVMALAMSCATSCGMWRAVEPEAVGNFEIAMPNPRRIQLPSGLTVAALRNTDAGPVRLSVVMRAGFDYDPPGKAGLARLVGTMLMLEASSPGNEARFGLLGAQPEVDVSRAGLVVSIDVLPEEVADGLNALAMFLQSPLPIDATLERARTLRKTALTAALGSPELLAGLAIARLFGGTGSRKHSLGYGSAQSLDAITAADVGAFVTEAVAAAESAVVAAGPVDTAALGSIVAEAFARWPAGRFRPTSGEARTKPREDRVVLVPVAGMVQVLVVVAGTRPHSSGSDAVAFDAALSRFGGELHHGLRVVRQLSYGISGGIPTEAGMFALAIRVRADKANVAVAEVQRAMDRSTEPPSPLWIDAFRRSGSVHMMEEAQDSAAMAMHATTAFLRGGTQNTLLDQINALQLIDDDEVHIAGEQHLEDGDVRIVVVGDPAVLGPQLGDDLALWPGRMLVEE